LAWAAFGLVLFEIGDWKRWSFLRLQAYVALTCGFFRIFYANFNGLVPATVAPAMIYALILVPIYFCVYWQLREKKTEASAIESKIRVEYLMAWLGAATLVASARFDLPLDAVVVGYAAIVLGALLVAWLMRLPVFLYQALVVLVFAAYRISTHNFFLLHEPLSSNFSNSVWAILLLAACVPVCFAMRQTILEETAKGPRWAAFLARYPEQPMFFVPAILTAVLIALQASGPKITFGWAAEAVLIILVGFFVRERSYVRSGLGLLLLCPVKVLAMDMWKIHDTGARALFVVGIGVMLMLGSFLFARNRETLRKFL
jgi:hypothetical protein